MHIPYNWLSPYFFINILSWNSSLSFIIVFQNNFTPYHELSRYVLIQKSVNDNIKGDVFYLINSPLSKKNLFLKSLAIFHCISKISSIKSLCIIFINQVLWKFLEHLEIYCDISYWLKENKFYKLGFILSYYFKLPFIKNSDSCISTLFSMIVGNKRVGKRNDCLLPLRCKITRWFSLLI